MEGLLVMSSYCIVRFFRDDRPRRVMRRGLTLAAAQAHCRSPETSSRTCTTSRCKAYTRRVGEWFDGFTDRCGRKRRRR